jgi:hypothetical protein
MPVPFPIVEKYNVKYEVPIQTKTYFCNYCRNERNYLRWVEKFSNEGFKCDNCWSQSTA